MVKVSTTYLCIVQPNCSSGNGLKYTALCQNYWKHDFKERFSSHVQRALFFTLTSLLFYFPEFPSWPYDFRFQFISFTPKRQKCILIYERHQYSAWARARLCWPSNKRELNIRWSDRGSISGMRCTGIRQQSGRYQRNGWHDNFLCVPKDAPYV